MERFEIGDLVVLTSGSMRMAVEAVEEGRVSVVWCHEGAIGRDAFDIRLLKKWEHREDDRPAKADGGRPGRWGDRGGDREGGGKPHRGERDGGGKPYRGGRQDDRDDRDGAPPRGRTGWDGKPRERKFFRKD